MKPLEFTDGRLAKEKQRGQQARCGEVQLFILPKTRKVRKGEETGRGTMESAA